MTQVKSTHSIHHHPKTSGAAEGKLNPAWTLGLEASRYFLSDIRAVGFQGMSLQSNETEFRAACDPVIAVKGGGNLSLEPSSLFHEESSSSLVTYNIQVETAAVDKDKPTCSTTFHRQASHETPDLGAKGILQ